MSLLALFLWARLLRGRRSTTALAGLMFTLAGSGLGVYGVWREPTLLTPVGLGVLGLGCLFLGIPLRRRGRPALGWLTIAMGLSALAGAIDLGLVMIPYLPVPPSVVRLVLEIGWVPWALFAALRGPVLAGARSSDGDRLSSRPYDPLERFTESLRW